MSPTFPSMIQTVECNDFAFLESCILVISETYFSSNCMYSVLKRKCDNDKSAIHYLFIYYYKLLILLLRSGALLNK
ncbi:unnamed protein product, partial [Brenthis ino]